MNGPELLIAQLERHGWTVCGRGRGFVRLIWPGVTDRTALFVPTDPSAGDFAELWQAALGELEDAVATGVQAARVLAEVHAAGGRVVSPPA